MGADTGTTIMSSLDCNSSGRAVAVPLVNIQIVCQMYSGALPAIAKRRFVYCWEKKNGQWKNIGLTITDDFGIICDLGKIIDDLENAVKRKSNTEFIPLSKLQVNAFDRDKKEWKKRPWTFFGETEDVVTFQKWLGEYIFSSEKYIKEQFQHFNCGRYIQNTFAYDDFVFGQQFYSLKEYRLLFNPASEYVFTFCPPDIVNAWQPSSVPQTSGGPSFTILQYGTLMQQANAKPDLKFWKQPHECWTGKYTTKKDDTLSGIAQRFGVKDWNDIYRANKEKIGSNPNKLSVNTELIIPQTKDALYFGSTFSAENIISSNATGKATLTTDIAPADLLDPFFSLTLPVNLEEYLSLLSYFTLLFDMEYAEVIRSMEEYGKTGYKLQQISFFLNLMKRFPGFDSGDFSDTEVKYYLDTRDDLKVPESDVKSLDLLISKCETLADEIGKAACSDSNAAYKKEKEELKNVYFLLKSLYEEPLFKKRVEQWKLWNEHIYAFNKADRQLALLPFTLRAILLHNESHPIIYPCIVKATCTVLLYGKLNKDDQSINDFYLKNVRPLERDLELTFAKNDIADNKKLAKKLVELGKDTFKDFVSEDDWYKKLTLTQFDKYSEPSVLNYIFSDILLKNILPSIWNTQVGPASYLDAIMNIATVYRYNFAITHLLAGNKISLAVSFLKIKLGQLRYAANSTDEIADALEEAFKVAFKEKQLSKNVDTFQRKQADIKNKFSEIDEGVGTLGKTKILVSRVTSALQVVLSLYDLIEFVDKYDGGISDKEAFSRDFYQLYKSMHSGVTASTGFNLNVVKGNPKLERIFNSGAKLLRFGSAAAMFIDAYMFYQEKQDAEKLGEDFIAGLRTTQAIISASAGVYLFLTLCTPLPFVPAVATIVGVTLLVLSIVEWIHEYKLKGIKKILQQIREEINNSDFKQRDVIFRSEGKNFMFFAVSYVYTINNGKMELMQMDQPIDNLKWSNPYQRYDNVIDKKFVIKWDEIAQLIGKQNYWNIEVIPAGREMKSKGFNYETIAFMTMKRSSLVKPEIRKIDGEPYRYEMVKVKMMTPVVNTYGAYAPLNTVPIYKNGYVLK